jgi:hypothetical protein
MLQIHCPVCKKSFLWTDDMPVEGKCPNADCKGNYDIHFALKQNIDRHAPQTVKDILLCPSCGGEIFSRFTLCRHCNQVVLGARFFKKSYLFMSVCIILILLSFIFRYLA